MPARAGNPVELTLQLQIPRLQVAEYHRPYVAIWIEGEDQGIARHLAVWYQTDPKKEDGTQWLKDLRQWWRRGGRTQSMPIDGVTGATRPAGEHLLKFNVADLPPGSYHLAVEAAREVGGRELLRLPFTLPATDLQQIRAQGSSELGSVSLQVAPYAP
ncbi:hypothetical protein ACG33_05550 [Steroidobacter denitrificans]|uniref:DUF2271 domain-containing protein n=1 Tax=Steroidobacter denitrificans TaxID=465721 RepID=A0A127FAI9_STEDE|nr:hypothetical protein ACG33_05550 [Steroidobacter denitrificans]